LLPVGLRHLADCGKEVLERCTQVCLGLQGRTGSDRGAVVSFEDFENHVVGLCRWAKHKKVLGVVAECPAGARAVHELETQWSEPPGKSGQHGYNFLVSVVLTKEYAGSLGDSGVPVGYGKVLDFGKTVGQVAECADLSDVSVEVLGDIAVHRVGEEFSKGGNIDALGAVPVNVLKCF
jgi:hypothetical protein